MDVFVRKVNAVHSQEMVKAVKILAELETKAYTGNVTLHFADGVPRKIRTEEFRTL